MDEPRPVFVWFIVVVVTVIFAMLWVSLPETIQPVESRLRGWTSHPASIPSRKVSQRPLLLVVWSVIVVPLAAWGVFIAIRDARSR